MAHDTILCKKGTIISNQTLSPGDFILVDKDGFYPRIIRFGQCLRFPEEIAKYSHAAIVEDSNGYIIEALGTGVVRAHIGKYTPRDYVYVHTDASEEDRKEVVRFAQHCLGDGYGWGSIVMLGLCLLTGLKMSIGFPTKMICSGLVAKALERTDVIFDEDSDSITPAYLARIYLNIH